MVKYLIIMLLTHFSFYYAPVTSSHRSPDRDVSLEEVFSYVTGPAAKDKTIELRALLTKEEKDKYKKHNLDYCTFSGQFGESRKSDCLIQHSGILMLDIDDLPIAPEEAKRKLLLDTHFTPLLLFTSPKGNGIKVAVQIDLNVATMPQYVNAFHAYFEREYGFNVDTHCKDVARACFLPWDPSAILNNIDAQVFFDPH